MSPSDDKAPAAVDGDNNSDSDDSLPADANVDAEVGRRYWQGVAADVNGMLGGFPHVSRVDLRGSRAFLAKLGIGSDEGKGLRRVERALEGGAGIGRITTGLLVDVAATVDVVEPIAKFTAALAGQPGVGRVSNCGLEEWQPPSAAAAGEESPVIYDIVWNQWCVGHLTDRQLVDYLRRCGTVLRRDGGGKVSGVIVVKENVTPVPKDTYDDEDSSVTRCDEKFKEIFEEAGLVVVRRELQNGFPKELYPVRMYALRPKEPKEAK